MSVLGLLIALLLSLIAVAIVARPLLGAAPNSRKADSIQAARQERVRNYYERVLTNIRDLDEDLATEKISAEDHGREREVWVARGISLLRLQDQLDARQESAEAALDIDARIEAAVAAYREGGMPAQCEGLR